MKFTYNNKTRKYSEEIDYRILSGIRQGFTIDEIISQYSDWPKLMTFSGTVDQKCVCHRQEDISFEHSLKSIIKPKLEGEHRFFCKACGLEFGKTPNGWGLDTWLEKQRLYAKFLSL